MENKDTAEYIQVHHVLGISDKRSEEITEEVLSALSDTGYADVAIKILMKRFDAESMLAGIRLEYLLAINKRLSHADRKTIERQNIPMN